MNDTQERAVNKLLDELIAIRNALEAWKHHAIDPREALASYTKPDGEVVIGDSSTWGAALESLENVQDTSSQSPAE